ncbi:MAG: DUF3068 domain-containing protein, partial [Nocardioidaceae bacterium]
FNQKTTLVSDGPNAKFFSVATLSPATGDLSSTRRVVGDVSASKEASASMGRKIAVWKSGVATVENGADPSGPPITGDAERAAFDAHTGEAVSCCGESYDNKAVKHSGLVFKFPFDAQKKTYPFWDTTLLKALPAHYKRTTTLDGVKVYEYVQDIARTKSGTTDLPASVVGLPGSATVSGVNYYQNVRTLWVEPETGVIIKGQEQQSNTIEAPGATPLVATDVTIGYDTKTVKDNADTYGSKGAQLKLVRVWAPLVAGVLAVLLLIAWVLLQVRGGSGRRRA